MEALWGSHNSDQIKSQWEKLKWKGDVATAIDESKFIPGLAQAIIDTDEIYTLAKYPKCDILKRLRKVKEFMISIITAKHGEGVSIKDHVRECFEWNFENTDVESEKQLSTVPPMKSEIGKIYKNQDARHVFRIMRTIAESR